MVSESYMKLRLNLRRETARTPIELDPSELRIGFPFFQDVGMIMVPERSGELPARRLIGEVAFWGPYVLLGLRTNYHGDPIPMIHTATMSIVLYFLGLDIPCRVESF